MDREADPLWEIAHKRIKFRFQLYIFLAVNGVLWALWIAQSLWQKQAQKQTFEQLKEIWGKLYPGVLEHLPAVEQLQQLPSGWTFPWPLFITLPWAVILLLLYMKAYSKVGIRAVEEEYTKLKSQKKDE